VWISALSDKHMQGRQSLLKTSISYCLSHKFRGRG
jgi:hypothetical protein